MGVQFPFRGLDPNARRTEGSEEFSAPLSSLFATRRHTMPRCDSADPRNSHIAQQGYREPTESRSHASANQCENQHVSRLSTSI
jgi:hypothetical protein